MPARQRVPDRFGECAASRQQGKLRLEPGVQSVDDRLGAAATSRKPLGWRLNVNVSFDGIEFADTAQGLYRDRRVRGLRHFIELPSRLAPACGEHNVPFLRQRLEPGVTVDMKNAAEVLEMRSRTFSFAVWRIQIDRGRRLRPAPCSLLAGVGRKPSSLSAPSTWIKHRYGRVIGEQMIRSEYVSCKAFVQRLEPPAGTANLSSERRTRKIDPVAAEDLRLTVERRVIAIFADQHLREQRRRRQVANDWPLCSRRQRHRLASPAGVFGTSGAITRSCAGTQSDISLTLSPMTCSAPQQQAQIMLSVPSRNSLRDKWAGNDFRREGRSPACFSAGGRFSSSQARSLSTSPSGRASWSGSRRSDRRPNCAHCNILMIDFRRSISPSRCSTATAISGMRCCEEPVRKAHRRDRTACSNPPESPDSKKRLHSILCGLLQLFSPPKPASIRVPEIANRCF
jgi:hypothetical protein